MRRGDFQREVAGLLPLPVAAVEARAGRGGPGSAVVDWLARLFGGDGGAAAAQLATSGAGRGLGAAAGVKVASLCLSGLVAGGGVYCAVTGRLSGPNKRPAQQRAEKPAAKPAPSFAPIRLSKRLTDPTSDRPTRPKRPRTVRKATAPQATPSARTTRVDTREAEQPVASSIPSSASGNDFNFEQAGSSTSVPTTPAPATGGGEFTP
jgi:hypothetical protein